MTIPIFHPDLSNTVKSNSAPIILSPDFKLFNLEEPSNPATFTPASYDIVFGSNVIHATRRLERSLTHVGHLLKPGGLLLLYEMVAPHDFVTITFGLLPGWWLFEDQRLPHSPLLDPNGWRDTLTRHGFDAVRIIGQPDAETESQATHALIMARRLDPTSGRIPLFQLRVACPSARTQAAVAWPLASTHRDQYDKDRGNHRFQTGSRSSEQHRWNTGNRRTTA